MEGNNFDSFAQQNNNPWQNGQSSSKPNVDQGFNQNPLGTNSQPVGNPFAQNSQPMYNSNLGVNQSGQSVYGSNTGYGQSTQPGYNSNAGYGQNEYNSNAKYNQNVYSGYNSNPAYDQKGQVPNSNPGFNQSNQQAFKVNTAYNQPQGFNNLNTMYNQNSLINTGKSKQSVLGIISFVSVIVATLIYIICMAKVVDIQKSFNFDPDEVSLIANLEIVSIVISIAGLVVGIVGIFMKDKKKDLAISGASANGVLAFILIVARILAS